MSKRAFLVLVVAILALTALSAKTNSDELRLGFEGGFGHNYTTMKTNDDERKHITLTDDGFFADGLIEYHFNDEWALKIAGGVEYQRKAQVDNEDESFKLDEKTGLTVDAFVLVRYNFYEYDGFSLFLSFGAGGAMGLIAPESETYNKDSLTNIGVGAAIEAGTEITVAYRTYLTLGIKGSYLFFNTTELATGDEAPLADMRQFVLRPYVGLSYRIE